LLCTLGIIRPDFEVVKEGRILQPNKRTEV
jgi:hypothetical protein